MPTTRKRINLCLDETTHGWIEFIYAKEHVRWMFKSEYVSAAIDRDRTRWLRKAARKDPEAVAEYRAYLEERGMAAEIEAVTWPEPRDGGAR